MFYLNYGIGSLDVDSYETFKEAKEAASRLQSDWYILKLEDNRTLFKACSLKGCSYSIIGNIAYHCDMTREEVEAKIYSTPSIP